jgi:propionyl-CoA carboxylase alpha chain
MTTITRVLVANRGEIARRVFATCRRLGIGTVAVHSDADAGLPFVAEADLAVRLPGDAPADTYLRSDLVLDAARRTGADAVHPGYGFLSENADFARAVIEAGLTWIGPDPASIEAMGSKVAAKQLMDKAGVPVLTNLDPADLSEADLPVLVKASAGGGGRGMRVVRDLADVADAVAGAEAEAASAFGDGTVFVETFVERGRHVEVQVLGDGDANISVLGDRDCSVQRRHQKVVEEAPAPGLPEEVRTAMHDAARAAAEAIGYRGAGTVEFLYDEAAQRFFFLEMNTRLQVEHPVTECVTGLDLVELQIAAAEGGRDVVRLPERPKGHAVEVRLYAEDPARDYQPQSGRLTRLDIPDVSAEFTRLPAYGVRLDSGFGSGDEVGTHYDAMLAKVIVWGPSREAAVRQLRGVLRRTRVHGVRTNRDLLLDVLGDPDFVGEELSTDYLARADLPSLRGGGAGAEVPAALFAAAVVSAEETLARRSVQSGIPAGWRNVTSAPQRASFEVAGVEVEVGWLGGRDGYRLVEVDRAPVPAARAEARRTDLGWRVSVDQEGVTRPFDVVVTGDQVDVDSPAGHVSARRVPRFLDPADQVAEGSLLAPMPGTVVSVRVAEGGRVHAGDTVLVMEAMKMQHTITAPSDGVVSELSVATGEQVSAGAVLAVVTPADDLTDDATQNSTQHPTQAPQSGDDA